MVLDDVGSDYKWSEKQYLDTHKVFTHYMACFQVKPSRLLMAAEILKTKLPKNNRLVIQSSVDMLRSYEY